MRYHSSSILSHIPEQITIKHATQSSLDIKIMHTHNPDSPTRTPPPGLTVDQYYLYLASGYVYSPMHGIMYLGGQAPSDSWISSRVSPYSIRPEETAFWLSHRHYYDFSRRRWVMATFVKAPQVQERIWRDAYSSQVSFGGFRRKAQEVTEMMAGMSVQSNVIATATSAFDKRPKPAAITTVRDKVKREKGEKIDLRKVAGENRIRTRHRTQAVREKVKTLPPSLSLNPGFWKTVM